MKLMVISSTVALFFSVNNTAFIFVLLLCYSRDEKDQCANSLTHSHPKNISLRVSRPTVYYKSDQIPQYY